MRLGSRGEGEGRVGGRQRWFLWFFSRRRGRPSSLEMRWALPMLIPVVSSLFLFTSWGGCFFFSLLFPLSVFGLLCRGDSCPGGPPPSAAHPGRKYHFHIPTTPVPGLDKSAGWVYQMVEEWDPHLLGVDATWYDGCPPSSCSCSLLQVLFPTLPYKLTLNRNHLYKVLKWWKGKIFYLKDKISRCWK